MSFSPFSCFLWLFSLLVASFFLFSSLKGVIGLLALFCVRLFFCFFVFFCFAVFVFLFFCWAVFHPTLSLLVLFSPVCWAWIHCWAFFLPRACSLAFPSFAILFLAICRAVFWYTDWFFSGLCLGLSLFSDSVDFSYSKGSFFLLFLGPFQGSFFYRAFLVSGSVLFSTPYIGLLCFLRKHAINSCVGDTWQRLWRDDFTHNGEQVVNRLKIPQGLSTLMFRRWSEVPSREGVCGDSP